MLDEIEVEVEPVRKHEIIVELLEDKIEEKKTDISISSDFDHILELIQEVKEIESIINEMDDILDNRVQKENGTSDKVKDENEDDEWTTIIDSHDSGDILEKYPHLNIYQEPIDFAMEYFRINDQITTNDLRNFIGNNLPKFNGKNYQESSLTTIACAHFEYMIQRGLLKRVDRGVYERV